MKMYLLRFFYLISLPAIFSACGILGAGSHVYCESILTACPSDSVIQEMTALKVDGMYDDARSFSDGIGEEANSPYSFYFYDHKHNFLAHLEVPVHTPKNTDIHLVGIKDFTVSNQWQPFNKNLTDVKKKEVLDWFNRTIQPVLACKRISGNP